MFRHFFFKVEKILKGSLDSIPSPSPSEEIQTVGGEVSLMCKSKILLGILKTTLFVLKSLLTTPSNVLPLHHKLIWIFTEGEGDGIESRLPFKIFSTLFRILLKIRNWWFSLLLKGYKGMCCNTTACWGMILPPILIDILIKGIYWGRTHYGIAQNRVVR